MFADPIALKLWVYVLLSANWQRRQLLSGQVLEAGQLFIGQNQLSAELKLSRQQLRTALKKLEACGNLTSKSTNSGTLLTVCNWATYQDDEDDAQPAEQPTANQPLTSEQPASNQQLTTEEEGKKERREEGKKEGAPTPEEFVRRWNAMAASKGLSKVRALTKTRRDKLKTRTANPDWFPAFVEACSKLPLGGDWQPNIDWFLRSHDNAIKMAEGAYDSWRNDRDKVPTSPVPQASEKTIAAIEQGRRMRAARDGGAA